MTRKTPAEAGTDRTTMEEVASPTYILCAFCQGSGARTEIGNDGQYNVITCPQCNGACTVRKKRRPTG